MKHNNKRIVVTFLGGGVEFDGFVSGGERHFLEVYKINSNKLEITTLTTESGEKKLQYFGVKSENILIQTPFKILSKKSHLFFYITQILTAPIKAFKIDHRCSRVISTSHFLFDLLPAIIIGKKASCEVFVYLHHVSPNPFRRSKYNPLFASIIAWLADRLGLFLIKKFANYVYAFPSVRDELIKKGFSKDIFLPLNNGIDVSTINAIDNIIPKIYFDATFVGRLTPLKGIFDLIEIWSQVVSLFPNKKLAVIGFEGRKQYRLALDKMIKEHSLEKNIYILGALDDNQKYRELKSSKLFIFPSYEEGWGISIAEAMICKNVVFTYDLDAYSVFEDGIIASEIGNKIEMAENIIRYLNNDNKIEEQALRAVKIANKFSWQSIADEEIIPILETANNNDLL